LSIPEFLSVFVISPETSSRININRHNINIQFHLHANEFTGSHIHTDTHYSYVTKTRSLSSHCLYAKSARKQRRLAEFFAQLVRKQRAARGNQSIYSMQNRQTHSPGSSFGVIASHATMPWRIAPRHSNAQPASNLNRNVEKCF
jgi:hypothetical protein